MPFLEQDGLKYYQFENLQAVGIKHGIFSRHGGVSPAPWDSLNLGGSLGDSRDNVIENRRRIFSIFDLPVASIFDVWQVHSADIIHTQQARPLDGPHQKGDGILSKTPGLSLFMRFADCVPILLYDPVQKAAGIVHSGWQGTVKKIVTQAILALKDQYHSQSEDILGCIGPSIGPDHYIVGSDVVAQVQKSYQGRSQELLKVENGNTYFNLWQANQIQMEELGLKSIEVARICTACHVDDWYSHRQENGKTGRFGAIIAI